jgi:hypothetical protein
MPKNRRICALIFGVRAEDFKMANAVTDTTAPVTSVQATKRVNVNFALPTYQTLEKIAERKDVSISQALRQSIALTDYIERAMDEGATILIKRGEALTELFIR